MQKAQASLERLGVVAALTGVNPVELLGDLIDQSAAIVAYLREQVAALPAVLTADGTHPLVRLYGQERDRAARVAREAVALGLEERRVRIDELTRDRLARLFLAAVADPERGPAARQRPGPWRSGQAPALELREVLRGRKLFRDDEPVVLLKGRRLSIRRTYFRATSVTLITPYLSHASRACSVRNS
jgi:hypothetical protein